MSRLSRRRLVIIGLAGLVGTILAGGVAWAITRGPSLGAAAPAPRFVDETATAGVDQVYGGEYPYVVGGGVAAFDCDGDGRQDLYVAGGGANRAGLYRNRSEIGGALRFERLRGAATDLEAVTGAYPIDIDGDGNVDLAVLWLGGNVLLRGLGDCGFERANETLGLDGGDDLTAAFSAKWEGDAGLPTLAFGNYVVLNRFGRFGGACADGALIRPAEGGIVYEAPLALTPSWCTLSMLFSDWDRSGRMDLRVSNDRHYYLFQGEEQLWRVEPGEPPRQYTRTEGWARLNIWGMGIASQDITGDSYPEVFLTSQGDNKLQTLDDGPARPSYHDIAVERGATAHRPYAGGDVLPSTAWHAEFDDVNNDGFMDLFIAKGNVEAQPDYAMRDPSNLLVGQSDGTFVEGAEAAGILSYARARGAALVDLNLDGMLDLVVVNRRENVGLWRNVGSGDATATRPMGGWLAIRLEQAGPNRDAIGAWVEVKVGERVVQREVTVGGGHAGGQLGWIHFGLGPAGRAEVRVQWPDGEIGPWQSVDGSAFVIVERGAAEARQWLPE